MSKFKLFEDQEEFVNGLREQLRQGKRSILGVASPAFGKTVVAAHIISQALEKTGASSWFLVHRKNLLRQTDKSFWSAGIEHGLMTSGKRSSKMKTQIGTIGTVHSRVKRGELKAPGILFIDEAHLAHGSMFSSVIQWAKDNGSIVIGLTGTPIRLDGKPLGDLFDVIVEAKNTKWLIDQKRLSDYIMYSAPQKLDLSAVKNMAGDYNKKQLGEVMSDRTLVGDAVSHWLKYANGLRTVVYCCNVKHSKQVAAEFNAKGIPAAHVDADTTEEELKKVCEGLADGTIKVMTNCELVIEGFDLSAQIGKDITLECCILLRPTQSEARYLQMVFRALRKKDRPAIILDHAGCAITHGLPDEIREWSLKGDLSSKKKKNKEEPDVKIKICDNCFAVISPMLSVCPRCKSEIKKKQVKIEQVDGELVDVKTMELKRKAEREQERKGARTLEDLVKLGLARKYKSPASWAANVFSSRQNRKPSPSDFSEARTILSRLMM